MHVNPTYMLMKPKSLCEVIFVSLSKFHKNSITSFILIWFEKNTVKTKYGFGFYRSYCYRNRKYNLLLSGCSDLQQKFIF